ncbi:MAG TPA: sulfite exporter TauE/SafE family protein [Anaerolineales bacterium]|nr:sulfite exporter TauE/SafE family protein [Anaerolineales bacterium]
MSAIFIKVFIGLVTGVVVGLTGASGMIVVIPLLTMLLGFPIHVAVGTSLFMDIITPLPVAWSYYRNGNVNLKSGLWLAVGALLGAQAGARIANTSISGDLMSKGFVFLVFAIAISMWIKSTRPERKISGAPLAAMTNKKRFITFGIGLVLGIISGLSGAGGGVMFLLVLLLVLKFPTHMAIGTSTLIMAFTAFSGTLGYALHGNVDFPSGLVIAVGSIIGGLLSANFANKVSEKRLNRAVGSVFACLGIVMIFLP